MTTSKDSHEEVPEWVGQLPVGEIVRAIKEIRHGSVHITVHDSKVVQIDKTEKNRLAG